MENKLQIFTHPQFGELEVWVDEKGTVRFPATESAKMLAYVNPHDAITKHCKTPGVAFREVGVQTGVKADGSPAMQVLQKKYIDLGNYLRLITHSQLPNAQKVEEWIFDEVLPSVITTGEYSAKNRTRTNDPLKQKRLEIMERNSRTNQAKLMLKFIESGALSEESAELVCIEATQLMLNKVLPYRPKSEKLYTATEIGTETGFTANWVGKVAGQHGLKTDEFSVVVLDTKKHSEGQIDTFRYNEKGRERLIELLKDSANWPKYMQEQRKKERTAN